MFCGSVCGSVGRCLFSRVVVSCILCNAQARGRGGTLRPGAWGLRSEAGDNTGREGESDEASSESEKTQIWV